MKIDVNEKRSGHDTFKIDVNEKRSGHDILK
jgi:hypothetical protein